MNDHRLQVRLTTLGSVDHNEWLSFTSPTHIISVSRSQWMTIVYKSDSQH